MADAYTGVAASTLDQAAYELSTYRALRRMLYFDQVADVKPTNQDKAGSSVIFNITGDLTPQTAVLNESTDVDATVMSDSQVTVTLVEQGGATITTAKLRGTSYVEFDPVVADVVAYWAAASMDVVAGAELVGGSNVRYATGGATDPTSRVTVEASDIISAYDTRRVLADLKSANAMPFGDLFAAFIHPDVEFDLRAETGAAAWRDPHTYSEPTPIWMGVTGTFEGSSYITTPSPSLLLTDAGSPGTVDVYITVYVGKQSLAKAYSTTDGNGELPQFVMGPVVDKLRRNVPVGWYWLGGYKRFREASIRRIESGSSIGANT